MTTSDRNSDHLLVPERRWRVTMYRTQLPPCLFQQVTQIRDRAFLPIYEAQQLRWECKDKSQLCHCLIGLPLLFLTCISTRYTPVPARPKLRSSGLGGAGSSAPGISCASGSSQGVENTCSTTTSWV